MRYIQFPACLFFLVFLMNCCLLLPVSFVLVCDAADHPAGYARGNDAVGNVLSHHRSGADDYIASNGNTRIDHRIRSHPHIASDGDLLSILQLGIAYFCVNGMSGCIDAYPGTEEHIVADMDLCHINDDAVVIGIKVFSDIGIAAIVTAERRFDPEAFPYFSQ